MDHVIEFLFFFLKAAVIVIAVLLIISNILAASLKTKDEDKNKVKFKDKSKEFRERKSKSELYFLEGKDAKKYKKDFEKSEKSKPSKQLQKLFVFKFSGDIKASQTDNLSHEISSVLDCAKPGDEALVLLESPGGLVSGYGLAASELKRLKNAGLKLNVCVDKVAASGGYMMACVADHIIAAPFAIIGSIGVVAQIPNFNKLLKKNNIDFEVITAGKYKRTLTLFGENTDEGREKFKDQIEDIHSLFKTFVTMNRPKLSATIDDVATGEYWFGAQCLDKNLVDEISTSEDYLFKNRDKFSIYEVTTEKKKSFIEKLSDNAAQSLIKKFEDMTLWKGL